MVSQRSCSIWIACALGCVGTAVRPARADSAEQQAEREYRLGYRALRAGDCAEALVHYRRSLALAQRPRTVFNIATCEEELAQDLAAWRDYLAFVDLAEERDAAIVAEARGRIEALRKRLRGRVTVDSTPGGASVTVDGERQPRSSTPVTLSLEPGPHVLRISSPASVTIERTVEITPDELTSLHVELALPSAVSIHVEPADAIIEPREGGAGGRGQLDQPVQPGRHVFTVSRAGYRSEDVVIDAVAGRTHEVHVELRPEPAAAMLVVAGIPGATIVLDGEPARAAATSAGTLELRGLSVGPHAIEVSQPGRVGWQQALQLSAGEVVTVDLDLPRRASPARRALAWGAGGFGIASVTTGGVFGVLALRDVASADPADHDRGKSRALVADGLFIAGAAALYTAWRLSRGDTPSAVIRRVRGGP